MDLRIDPMLKMMATVDLNVINVIKSSNLGIILCYRRNVNTQKMFLYVGTSSMEIVNVVIEVVGSGLVTVYTIQISARHVTKYSRSKMI